MKQASRLNSYLTDDGRYRLLVDAITDYAVYMLDEEGYVSSWNPGAQRFKGYDADEIIGHHFSDFYTEEDKQKELPKRALARAAEEGRFEGEGWRVRKDGTRFWAHVVIDPIRDPSGHLIGYAKITRDLTERKLSEEALKKSEQQFRLLVQGVTDYAIYMLDPLGHITSWNAGAQKIKGYLPEEIIGQHFSIFYTAEDREKGEPQRGLGIAAREGRFEKEAIRIRKDGTRLWANVVIDAIRNDQGEVIGFAKVTRDISEKKEAEHALERAREAFFQSQKMEAIGQLTGGVAHDFNNLLMAITSSLELMKKRLPDDPKIMRLLENAMQGAQRGASLTKRMLAFARKQDLQQESVDVHALIGGMSDLLERALGPSTTLTTEFPSSLGPVQVDPNQLELALLNLAVNARDAMPEGGIIRVTARKETITGTQGSLKPGDYICITLTDTGSGMDEETLTRAMEPFFTTKGIGKGTGLGLSMVHGLAEQSGGSLLLKSEKGQGTTAELWLPVAQVDSKMSVNDLPSANENTLSRTLKALAVDDDSLVLMNTVMMLEDLGHSVTEATSAKEALAILHGGETFDIVITDQAMPNMTGIQLAKAIKNEWPRLPVVLATGYAELPDLVGVNLPRLSKPFSQKELAKILVETAQS